jgi:hypothetical protein
MQGELFSAGAEAVKGEQGVTVGDRTREKAPKEFRQTTPAEFQALITRAVQEGRHSLGGWQTVCSRCRQWVSGIYANDKQSHSVHYCLECAAAVGDSDARAELEKRKLQEEFNPEDIPI